MEAKLPKKRGRKPKQKNPEQEISKNEEINDVSVEQHLEELPLSSNVNNLDSNNDENNNNDNNVNNDNNDNNVNDNDNNNDTESVNITITTDIIHQKKKRGRKPKPKIENEEVKKPKKRGRKPKEIFKPSEPSNFQISEEAVILHLNIKNNNDSILNIEDEFVKYNPSISIPTPFVPEDLENAFYLKENTQQDNENLDNTNYENNTNNIENFNENDNENDTITNTNLNNDGYESTDQQQFNQNNMKMNINIEEQLKLANKQNTPRKEPEEYMDSVSNKNKCYPIFIEYVDANKNNSWPSKTNIDCLFCSHSFENEPFGIPIKKVFGKYLMFGNFCMAECAAAFIFDNNFFNDSEKAESYSLLNYLYGNGDGIKIAPNKLCLKRFGGRLTIEQYRNNLKSGTKNLKVIIPPLTSVIPNVEETNISKSLNDIGTSFFNSSIVSKSGELLRLKRQRPLPDSNNTLEACMNLKLL